MLITEFYVAINSETCTTFVKEIMFEVKFTKYGSNKGEMHLK